MPVSAFQKRPCSASLEHRMAAKDTRAGCQAVCAVTRHGRLPGSNHNAKSANVVQRHPGYGLTLIMLTTLPFLCIEHVNPEAMSARHSKRRTVHVRRQGALDLVLRIGLQPGRCNRPVARHALLGRRPFELVPVPDFAILPHSFAAHIAWQISLVAQASLNTKALLSLTGGLRACWQPLLTRIR